MSDTFRRAARTAITEARKRADSLTMGELVRYPRLHGTRVIDAVGTITQIRCVTPDLPYNDRTLEFTLRCDDGTTDRLRVSNGYRGIVLLLIDRE